MPRLTDMISSGISMQAYGTSEGVTKAWDTRGRNGKTMHQVMRSHGFKPDPQGDPKSDFKKTSGGRTHLVSLTEDEKGRGTFDHYSGRAGLNWERADDRALDYKEHGGGVGSDRLEAHLNRYNL